MVTRWWTAPLFVVGATFALGAAYAVSEAVDPVHPTLQSTVSLFAAHSAEIEAVTVGNSHSRAVDFAAFGVPGVNLWEPGHDAFEATYMARYAAPRAPRLRYVLFAASFGLPRLDHAAITTRDLTGGRHAIYLRARGPRFVPGDHELWVQAQAAPVARHDHWRGVIRHLADRRPPVNPEGGGDARTQLKPILHPDSLARYGARRAWRHAQAGDETLRNAPDTPARVTAELEALARRLRTDGVVLVLYTPPYHDSYLVHFQPGILEEMRSALDPILKHPNAIWMDFSTDPTFSKRAGMFRDSDHLSPAGAREFSALLRRCLDALPDMPADCHRVLPGGGAIAAGRADGPSHSQKEIAW